MQNVGQEGGGKILRENVDVDGFGLFEQFQDPLYHTFFDHDVDSGFFDGDLLKDGHAESLSD